MRNPVYARLNLETGQSDKYYVPQEYIKKYIGGKAIACKLLMELTQPGIEPLDPEAMIIINTGPMNGTGAPSSSRFNISFKNVLTGGIGSSNCGGQFGVMLKRAGYDGLILAGKAKNPCLIQIEDGTITLKDAKKLWGMDMEETQSQLPEGYGKLVIGPAGEHLVRYAAIGSGERMAGRCGGGAVLGSKNVKALIAYGVQNPEIAKGKKYRRFLQKWTNFLRKHPMTGEALPRYGSAGLVNKANASCALPTHNFKYGHFETADKVSGETLSETILTRNGNCISCPIRCERRVMVDGKEVKGPEYETLGLFGPNIEGDDLSKIDRLNYICDILGMDTISAAGTIAFAMELEEQGIKDFGLSFGETANLEEILYKIAKREGVGDELANGSKWLGEQHGGKEYAIHAKGLELASYEPRRSVGMGLGYATSNRGGCHLNGGYMALLESVGVLSIAPQSPKSKAAWTVFMQNGMEAISCAGFCLFSAQTFVPAIFFRLGPAHWLTRMSGGILKYSGGMIRLLLHSLSIMQFNSKFLFPHVQALRLATGYRFHTGRFIKAGERCYNLERLYNLREGLTKEDDTLPRRLTQTPQEERLTQIPQEAQLAQVPQETGSVGTVVPLDQMLPSYYKIRGWNENGVPKEKKLKRMKV